MKTTYFEEDDILVIRLSDKPVVREVTQGWHTHISYAQDNTAVELVVLEASTQGLISLEVDHVSHSTTSAWK